MCTTCITQWKSIECRDQTSSGSIHKFALQNAHSEVYKWKWSIAFDESPRKEHGNGRQNIFTAVEIRNYVPNNYAKKICWAPLTPAWISNCIHCKVWNDITYSCPNISGTTVEVSKWVANFISFYWAYDYLSMPIFPRGIGTAWRCYDNGFRTYYNYWVVCFCLVNISRFLYRTILVTLQWRHNEHDSVSNHQPNDCLPNGLFGRRSKVTSKLRVTGLCVGNSPLTGEFPAQKDSNAENVSIWWRHHADLSPVSTKHPYLIVYKLYSSSFPRNKNKFGDSINAGNDIFISYISI